jgi:ABC-2 type transport system ATP-binding protein
MILPRARAEGLRVALGACPAVASVEEADADPGLARVTAFPRVGANLSAALAAIGRDPAHAIEEIRVERGRLDEVFRQVTTRPAAAARTAA